VDDVLVQDKEDIQDQRILTKLFTCAFL